MVHGSWLRVKGDFWFMGNGDFWLRGKGDFWLRVNGERDRDAIEYDALCISKR